MVLRAALLIFAITLSRPALAATRPVDCTLVVGGKSYISGVCEFVRDDKNGSFSIYGDKYWATVDVEDGKGEAHWNGAPYASHAQGPLGEVHQNGGCWEGPKVRVCALALDHARRDAIMAGRPTGLRITPETWDSFCVSAAGYRFVPGAALMMDRCDYFWGVRQRVFQLAEGKVSLAGQPQLCIGTTASADGRDATLVLDDCARVTVRWTYDSETKLVRSDSGLCWDIQWPDYKKGQDWPSAITAHACAQEPDKNSRFVIGDD